MQYSPTAFGTSQIQVNLTQVREEMGHPVILMRYRVPNGIDGWVVVHDEDEGICNRLQFVLWGGTDSQIALLWCECLISNEFMLNGLTFDEHGKFGYDFMKTN